MNADKTRRWWALGALALAVLAVGLDGTVLNVALPTLATDLHASTGDLQWIVDAYILVLGRAAAARRPARRPLRPQEDAARRARAVRGRLAGAAPTPPRRAQLIAARALLGLGAAVIIPLSLSVLPVLFSRQERPRAIAVVGRGQLRSAFPLGPILGGWLLDHFWWGSVFLINVPMVALGLLAVAAAAAGVAQRPAPPAWTRSGVLVVQPPGWPALIYGVIEAGAATAGPTHRAAPRSPAGVAGAGRLRRLGAPAPRPAASRWSTWRCSAPPASPGARSWPPWSIFAMFGVLFTMPQYFQAVLGTDALGTGLRLLPLIGGLLVGASTADRRRRPARRQGHRRARVRAAGRRARAPEPPPAVTPATASSRAWIAVVGLGHGLRAAHGDGRRAGRPVRRAQRRRLGADPGGAPGRRHRSAWRSSGSVLNAGYHGRLDLTGLPPAAAEAVRDSVAAGIAVAHQLGVGVAAAPRCGPRSCTAWTCMLLVCAGMAVAGVVLALVFLPRRAAAPATRGDRTSRSDGRTSLPEQDARRSRSGCASGRRPRPAPRSGSTPCGCSASRATRPPRSSRSPRRPRSPPAPSSATSRPRRTSSSTDDYDPLIVAAFRPSRPS